MRKAEMHLDSAKDADNVCAELFVKMSLFIRLLKTPQSRQDEYVLVRPIEAADIASFFPRVYQKDRDINDMLSSGGIPTVLVYPVLYDSGTVKVQRMSVLSAWRRDPQTQRGRLTGFTYVPGGAEVINGKLNVYRDVSVPALPYEDDHVINDILHHIGTNICNGSAADFTYVISWLAHMVQKPAVRPMTGIAIIGDQGSGKGILANFLGRMLGGDRNCNLTASSTDTKAFNAAIANKLLVVFDEATFAGDRQQSDFMKKLVTEPRIRVEPKGIDAYEVENFTRVLITSNNMTSAVPAGIGARRWLIIECKNDVDPAWLKKLAIKIGNAGAHPDACPNFVNWFKYFLETLDISDFDPLALPMQSAGFDTKLGVLYKEDPLKAFFWEWLMAEGLILFREMKQRDADGGVVEVDVPLEWKMEVNFADFYAVFAEHCVASFVPTPARNRLKSMLAQYGATVVSRKGNVRHVVMPHPSHLLSILRKTARFDDPLSPEQKRFINMAWQPMDDDEDEVNGMIFRPLTPAEKARSAAKDAKLAAARDAQEKAAVDAFNASLAARVLGTVDKHSDIPGRADGVVHVAAFDPDTNPNP